MAKAQGKDGDGKVRAEHGDQAGKKDGQLDALAASLRRAYNDAVAEDVPDSLTDLLDQLR